MTQLLESNVSQLAIGLAFGFGGCREKDFPGTKLSLSSLSQAPATIHHRSHLTRVNNGSVVCIGLVIVLNLFKVIEITLKIKK